MKRSILFVVFAASAISVFAAGRYGEPELPGWLTFIGIVMIVWGVLEIVLFFKVWGMTNDVNALKKDHFNETVFESKEQMARYLRRNLVLGNTENVKRTLLKNFIDNVEHGYGELQTEGYEKDEKGDDHWVSFRERNLMKSVRPYVENLQNQYEKIGEPLPVYIQRMETFNDYYKLFVEDDLNVEVEEKTEE